MICILGSAGHFGLRLGVLRGLGEMYERSDMNDLSDRVLKTTDSEPRPTIFSTPDSSRGRPPTVR